jgi:hypothetical protein
VACWNEDIMRGQLMQGLSTRLLFLTGVFPNGGEHGMPSLDELCEPHRSKYHDWAVPFWRWFRAAQAAKNVWASTMDLTQRAAGLYVWSFDRLPADLPWTPDLGDRLRWGKWLPASTHAGTVD